MTSSTSSPQALCQGLCGSQALGRGVQMGGGVGRLEEYLRVPRKKFGFKDDGTIKKAREKKGTGKK